MATSTTKIYFGNLNWNTTNEELEAYVRDNLGPGEKVEAIVLRDRETQRSRGFAFVTVSAAVADELIGKVNEQEFDGRRLKVNLANNDGRRGGDAPFKGYNRGQSNY